GSAEEAVHVSLNFLPGNFAPVGVKQLIGICKDRRKRAPRVVPLVDHLLQDARVGMLWNKTGSQQFDPLSGDFFDDRRIVQEPPAAERHQVIEFSRVNRKFVLILAAEYAHQEAIVRKAAAKILDST